MRLTVSMKVNVSLKTTISCCFKDSLLESLRNKFKKERQPLVANNEIQRLKERWARRKRPLQTAEAYPSTTVKILNLAVNFV